MLFPTYTTLIGAGTDNFHFGIYRLQMFHLYIQNADINKAPARGGIRIHIAEIVGMPLHIVSQLARRRLGLFGQFYNLSIKPYHIAVRSEERRVGRECRYRMS